MLTYVNTCSILEINSGFNVRPKHPNKEIEQAICYAESEGWRYQASGKSAHAWGKLLCPLASREGHSMSVWSTPRNTENHAKQIKRNVDACDHQEVKDE